MVDVPWSESTSIIKKVGLPIWVPSNIRTLARSCLSCATMFEPCWNYRSRAARHLKADRAMAMAINNDCSDYCEEREEERCTGGTLQSIFTTRNVSVSLRTSKTFLTGRRSLLRSPQLVSEIRGLRLPASRTLNASNF